MNTKFQKVIEEYNKRSHILGDDEAIQRILASCNVSIEELPELASYLAEEFQRTLQEELYELNDNLEQLEYAVLFIQEARSEGYTVNYESIYIPKTAHQDSEP